MSSFPIVKLTGGPRQRGLSHGRQLADRIHRTFNFYNEVVFENAQIMAADIQKRSVELMEITRHFSPSLITEIEAIAQAAQIKPWCIFLLNARTEILNASVAECTSLAIPETRILAQTWDWIRELEELVVIAEIENEEGLKIITLIEPGMLSKIGMNSCGLGVGLNFLKSDIRLEGVPVHLLIRAVLNCSNIGEARKVVSRAGFGKASYVPVATAEGDAVGFEFADNTLAEIDVESGVILHTNHCVSGDLTGVVLPTSQERYTTMQAALGATSARDYDAVNAFLSNDAEGVNAVQANYHQVAEMNGLEIGTCATIIMELDKRKFHIRRGPNASGGYAELAL